MSEAQAQRTYLPAAGHDWALPLYDPLVKLLGLNATRRVLIEQAMAAGATWGKFRTGW